MYCNQPPRAALLRRFQRTLLAGAFVPLLIVAKPHAVHCADASSTTGDVSAKTSSGDVKTNLTEQRAATASNRFTAAIQAIHAKSARLQSASGNMAASRKKADEALTAFAARTISVDVVLDAQRRQADAEIEYARTAVDQCDMDSIDARLAFHVMELKALRNAKDATLAVWRLATALKNTGVKGFGPEVEAQAREQHTLFSGLIENSLAAISREDARSHYNATRSNGAD